MTAKPEAGIPEDWKQVARKDWQRIHRQLQDGDAEAAGYFLQQALEKYLKAFLLQQGWHLRKIHVLHELLSDAVKHRSTLEGFRELCERVSGYYVIDRYPPLAPSGLTGEDIRKDQQQAQRFIQLMFPEERLEP